ncbi:MAG: hypothetical protein K2N06_10260 [Oscillospiraceae bacterium]|nr:hypothetical protein [Oscillospiraceae bacterium]
MNIAPIYELKSRLRAAAIAGTNLLSEDFRLKRAVEGFAPLEKASPVFAKIGEMTNALLADNSPANLLDTITLVDSVITTLGTLDVKDEIEDLPLCEFEAEIIDIPCSKLKSLIDALTTPGSGKYEIVRDAWDNSPELFSDYRVTEPVVKALGAKYSETAYLAEKIVDKIGSRILPLLKKGFNPKGGAEMERRFNFIEDFGGASENEFYLANLDESEKLMRRRMIYALRLDAGNLDRLIELSKTEKGKFKQAALGAIINIDSPEAEKYIREYAEKKRYEIFLLIRYGSSRWTSVLTAELMERLLTDEFGKPYTLSHAPDKTAGKNKAEWMDCIYALMGKFGPEVEKIYREFHHTQSFDPDIINRDRPAWQLDRVLGESIIQTDDDGLKKLAIELNTQSVMKGRYPLSEVFARLTSDEDCLSWLKEKLDGIPTDRNLMDNSLLKPLESVYLRNGEYVISGQLYADNELIDKPIFNYGKVRQPISTKITDLILTYYKGENVDMKNWAKHGPYFERVIYQFINPDDKEMCKRVSDYIQKFPLERTDIDLLKQCGARNVKGLAYVYAKDMDRWDTYLMNRCFKMMILGDHDFKIAEAEQLIELAAKRKLLYKPDEQQIESLRRWLDGNRETL